MGLVVVAYYHETHKILGKTYGMCALQDFEALTPNLLARTEETVEGGGAIVLLVNCVVPEAAVHPDDGRALPI